MSKKFYKILIMACLVAAFLLLLCFNLFCAPPKQGDYQDFLDALAMRESSDNYAAENRFGYLGRYQMGETALRDAGFLDENGDWTELANDYGIFRNEDFLESPRGQDRAIRGYHEKLCHYIRNYALMDYEGREYCGVAVTASGLLAACHLVGARSMKEALAANEPVTDANGVPALEYMARFSGYDIGEVWQ